MQRRMRGRKLDRQQSMKIGLDELQSALEAVKARVLESLRKVIACNLCGHMQSMWAHAIHVGACNLCARMQGSLKWAIRSQLVVVCGGWWRLLIMRGNTNVHVHVHVHVHEGERT